MLKYLPAPLRGALALLLYSVNTIGCFVTMLPVIFLKVVLFVPAIRRGLTGVLMRMGSAWIEINSGILWLTQDIEWDIDGIDGFGRKDSYLVISNHRSWADIFVLQHLFKHRIPFLKFFLKKELIWVPLMGVAWWALDFPFMKRYSRDYIQKHPEMKGKDIETTRRYCARFKNSPISVINFLEGTRFDYQKQKKQQSPYRHLLLPRAGGVAIVLSAMGDCLTGILDVTIAYPHNQPPLSFWDFLSGKIKTVVVRVRSLPIPERFVSGNYEQDPEFQRQFRQWVNDLWGEKDRQIEAIVKHYHGGTEEKES
ncbi:MAG: acyltransferase [Thermodesulfobacteriota bacterium]